MVEDVQVEETELTAPVIINATPRGSAIQPAVPAQGLAAQVLAGRIVILKGAFAPELMLTFRRALSRWGTDEPPFP